MALLFCDSQDHYISGDLAKKYTSISAGWLNSATGYTTGGASATLVQPTTTTMPPMGGAMVGFNVVSSNYGGLLRTITAGATFVLGGWFYFASNPAAYAGNNILSPLLGLADGNTLQFGLWGDGSGHLTVVRGITTVATSANTLTLNTWHHIEMKVKIDPSAGTYEVRVNGSAWIGPTTGANTRQGSNSSADRAIFGANYKTDTYLKNNYILNDSGSVANDFIGPCRIAVLRPANAGALADWTANGGTRVGSINEVLFDGDNSFNQSGTAGHKDTFDMNAMPAASGTIHGVQAVLGMRQDAGAQRTVRVIQRHSGSDTNWTSLTPTASHLFYCDAKSVSPVSSSAFTIAEIDGDEWGYELVS